MEIPLSADHISKYLSKLLLGLFVFFFCVLILNGFYAIPYGDDYTYAISSRNSDFWATQWGFYSAWSSRYSSTFILTGLPLFFNNYEFYFIVPLFLFIGFICGLFFLLKQSLFYEESFFETFFYTMFIAYLFIKILPALNESFFWLNGGFTYQLGLNLALFFSGLLFLLWRKPNPLGFGLAIVMIFIVAGFNESLMIYQFFITGVFAFFCYVKEKESRVAFLLLLISSLMAVALVIGAPGNYSRQSTIPKAKSLSYTLRTGVIFPLRLSLLTLRHIEVFILSLLIFPKLKGFWMKMKEDDRKIMKIIWLFWPMTFIVLCSLAFGWATGAMHPPKRFFVAPVITYIIGVPLFLFFVFMKRDTEQWCNKPYVQQLLLVVLIFSVLGSHRLEMALGDIGHSRKIYFAHQERMHFIQAALKAGDRTVVLPSFKDSSFVQCGDITTDAEDWKNKAYASYFGLNQIVLDRNLNR